MTGDIQDVVDAVSSFRWLEGYLYVDGSISLDKENAAVRFRFEGGGRLVGLPQRSLDLGILAVPFSLKEYMEKLGLLGYVSKAGIEVQRVTFTSTGDGKRLNCILFLVGFYTGEENVHAFEEAGFSRLGFPGWMKAGYTDTGTYSELWRFLNKSGVRVGWRTPLWVKPQPVTSKKRLGKEYASWFGFW